MAPCGSRVDGQAIDRGIRPVDAATLRRRRLRPRGRDGQDRPGTLDSRDRAGGPAPARTCAAGTGRRAARPARSRRRSRPGRAAATRSCAGTRSPGRARCGRCRWPPTGAGRRRRASHAAAYGEGFAWKHPSGTARLCASSDFRKGTLSASSYGVIPRSMAKVSPSASRMNEPLSRWQWPAPAMAPTRKRRTVAPGAADHARLLETIPAVARRVKHRHRDRRPRAPVGPVYDREDAVGGPVVVQASAVLEARAEQARPGPAEAGRHARDRVEGDPVAHGVRDRQVRARLARGREQRADVRPGGGEPGRNEVGERLPPIPGEDGEARHGGPERVRPVPHSLVGRAIRLHVPVGHLRVRRARTGRSRRGRAASRARRRAGRGYAPARSCGSGCSPRGTPTAA